MMTDPISDMLTRIRNAGRARHVKTKCPASKVKLAIAKLPEDYREIVDLRYVQEKSVQETAEITGKSPDAIQGICRRAKQKMLKTLGNASLYFSRSG